MLKILTIILFILLLTLNLFARTIEVNIDGSAQLTSIQTAVTCTTHGDTILVYPGYYIENIDYLGREIIITSLYLSTGDRQYINNTIIDGNELGTTIKFNNYEGRETVLCGFTITGGSGYQPSDDDTYGGGIYIANSSPTIKNCIIEYNHAGNGGGMAIRDDHHHPHQSYPLLQDLTLRENVGRIGVGGLFMSFSSNAEFSQEIRCNIYDNYSYYFLDFDIPMNSDYPNSIEVYLDTISVNNPTDYHFWFGDYGEYVLDWQNYKHEKIYQDVYVSPDGNDSNSGLTPDDPFKHIHYAVSLIDPSEDNPLTIRLDSGIYSLSETGEYFPLYFKNYLTYSGAGMDETILDAEYNSIVMRSESYQVEGKLENLTINHGMGHGHQRGGIYLGGPKNTIITNVKFLNNKSNTAYSALGVGRNQASPEDNCYIELRNVIFDGNLGNYVISHQNCDVYAENIVIRNSGPNLDSTDEDWGWESYGSLFMGYYYYPEARCNITFVNSHFHDNFSYSDLGVTTVGIFHRRLDIAFINCTFADNVCDPYGYNIVIRPDQSVLTVKNCVFHDNDPWCIGNNPTDPGLENTLYLSNSIFDDEGCVIFDEGQYAYIDSETVFYGNPLFIDNQEQPYQLDELSPCIDTGTEDIIPGFVLPFYDIIGNPRIHGETIDMGCYEWQGTENTENQLPYLSCKLMNYPNPFNPETIIDFLVSKDTEIFLTIYNIRGQLVKTLINSQIEKGRHQISWNGKNESGQSVSSGIYYCRLKSDNQETVKKMILIK